MKKGLFHTFFLTADILLMLATAALIPLNLLFYDFPEWVTLIAVGVLVTVNGGYFEKFDPKKLSKVLLILLALPIIAFTLLGSYFNPYWNSLLLRDPDSAKVAAYDEVLTYDEAKEDLDYALHYLQKCHPLFLDHNQNNVLVQYQQGLKHLENSHKITVNDLRREVQQMFALMRDAHTTQAGLWNDRYLKTAESREYAGWQIAAVNGQTLETLFRENKNLFSYEVESWAMKELRAELCKLSGLHYLGIDPEGVTYSWVNNIGTVTTETYTSADFLPYQEYTEYNKTFRTEKEDDPFVSYTIDEDKSLALLTLRSCDYNKEFISCVKEMFTEVKEKNIRNVAVDLRNNGGGSSQVANEIFRYLNVEQYRTGKYVWRFGWINIPFNNDVVVNHKYADLTFDGKFFLLTNTESFSSAMLFAEYVKDNQLGMLIGEPPGNTPNGYGEVAAFQLPHSGLYCQVSTKKFLRIDSKTGAILVVPNVECKSKDALTVLYGHLEEPSEQ